MANSWDEFFASPIKASKRLHVTAADVARGAKIDARNAQRKAAAEALLAEQSRTVPTGLPYGMTPRPSTVPSDAPNLYEGDNTKAARPDLISNALLAGNLGGLSSAFGALAPLRAGLAIGAGSDAVLNAGESGGLPAAMAGAGVLGRRALPMALATGAAYAGDATAGSRYDPSAFLKYIRQHFPDMFDSAKQGMKFTADTGREAGVYGLLDDSMSVKPRMIVHGSTNSVALPRDVRRELIDSANAFDMHTHPSGNALPSTPLNNAAQNALGGDTEYYQRTSRGTPWLRPGKADNLIVSVQPRAVREPLDFGNGRGESWTHMKMNEYPSKQELNSLDEYLVNNADRYENMLPMGDIGMMIPDDLNTFALLKHYADTGRGDFTYNLGKEVFGPGGREPATPMYEAIYNQLRKDKQLRNYADGGLVKSGLKMLFPNLSAPLHVVKPKGGNWLSGSVEDALKGLRSDVVRYDHPRFKELLPEDQSRLNADGVFGAMHDFTPEIKARISEKVAPINNWIEGPLTKYVKNRMASPEDEVRKLAEQGVLHYEPAMIRERSPLMDKIVGRREAAGFPLQGLADAPIARSWENTSDTAVRNLEALDLSAAERAATFGGKTVPKETIVHELNPFASGAGTSDLGFPHLIDELSNALDPNSGLPRHLQLSPDAVKNLSMEKAVRRVADINAWRAAQIAEANQKIAGGPGQELVREYPHTPEKPNPKGLRWVELKKSKTLPEGWSFKPGEGEYAGYDWYFDPEGKAHNAMNDPRHADLEKQLKYEGDTMGHCVGGYCDDVASGRSRIFSLRDAKGEPHVTVEVAPGAKSEVALKSDAYQRKVFDILRENGVDPYPSLMEWINNGGVGIANLKNLPIFIREMHPELEPLMPKYGKRIIYTEQKPSSIVQIKGKQNRAPNEEYLPFVQDFVRSSPLGQPWAEVGDLQNTGLRRTIDAFNSNELKKIQEAGIEVPTHATSEELEAINRQIWPDPDVRAGAHPDGFASGGLVEKTSPWSVFSGHNSADWPEEL